ncbi:Endoribonuclease YbeY [Candidatus Ecksteinia adelgidicola]|nr:Endoribonuclease YbeY [Candidatus Ecksteinia adelgidicola]
MKIILDLQIACKNANNLPKKTYFEFWLNQVLSQLQQNTEITIRLVDKLESQTLNLIYRNKNKPTNILSFSYKNSLKFVPLLLGDLVICKQLVIEEAFKQKKLEEAYWAHMVVHGSLHLLGYNHMKKNETKIMESLEINIMKKLGYINPY